MKRMMMVCCAAVLFGSSAWADSEKAALIATFGDSWDGPCYMNDGEGREALGSVHYVEVNNGIWSLECRGLQTSGPPAERAIVVNSTAENKVKLCGRGPYGPPTWDMHLTITPSGRMVLSCHGLVDSD